MANLLQTDDLGLPHDLECHWKRRDIFDGVEEHQTHAAKGPGPHLRVSPLQPTGLHVDFPSPSFSATNHQRAVSSAVELTSARNRCAFSYIMMNN